MSSLAKATSYNFGNNPTTRKLPEQTEIYNELKSGYDRNSNSDHFYDHINAVYSNEEETGYATTTRIRQQNSDTLIKRNAMAPLSVDETTQNSNNSLHYPIPDISLIRNPFDHADISDAEHYQQPNRPSTVKYRTKTEKNQSRALGIDISISVNLNDLRSSKASGSNSIIARIIPTHSKPVADNVGSMDIDISAQSYSTESVIMRKPNSFNDKQDKK